LPPGIYSNKPQYRSPGGPITVMLLDAVNTAFSDHAYARRQMLAFVQQQVLLHMDLDPQPGNNQLRLGVQDNRTGLVGSLGAPMPQ
jgi:hypothetical protein